MERIMIFLLIQKPLFGKSAIPFNCKIRRKVTL